MATSPRGVSRRAVLGAAYVAPAVLVLRPHPSFAQSADELPSETSSNGPSSPPSDGPPPTPQPTPEVGHDRAGLADTGEDVLRWLGMGAGAAGAGAMIVRATRTRPPEQPDRADGVDPA